MTINELLDVLNTIPYNKLTKGTVYCRVNTFTYDASSLARVDIDFMRGNTCMGFIRVFGNNTINSVQRINGIVNETMEQVIAYLEILGFKNDC